MAQSVDTRARRAVATYSTYREAERAVDYLSDRKFPVDRVSIVGRDLEYVEHVTGRMNWGRAAFSGALTGALVGFLVGWLFGLFDWFDPIVSAFWLAIDGLWFGALVGALFGLLTYALLRGRRDFSSVSSMHANRYEVLVDEEVADEAARLITQLGRLAGTSGNGGAGTTSEAATPKSDPSFRGT